MKKSRIMALFLATLMLFSSMTVFASSADEDYYYVQGNIYIETQSGTQIISTYDAPVLCPNCNIVEYYVTTQYPENWRLIDTETHGEVNGGDAEVGYHYTYMRRIKEIYECIRCSHTSYFTKTEYKVVKDCSFCN